MNNSAHTSQDRAFYSHWHSIPIRHADLDDLRHVNNAIYSVYCEEARRQFFQPARQIQRDSHAMLFVVRLSINFHREMTYPGIVDIGTAVSRIGNSSFAMMQGLFTEHGCHASVEVVTVVASENTRRSMPIPQPMRDFLSAALARCS